MNRHILPALIGLASLLAIHIASADDALTKNGAPKPLRIVIIGDSTVCEYPETQPTRGWGHFVQERFKDGTVQVVNLAASGRSTKTFIAEGRWQKALDEKPDFVLIQFGHNDSHAATNPEATDAATNYKDHLRRYIDESRTIGATPILVTPMIRRSFDAQGKVDETKATPGRALGDYTNAMKQVGEEKKAAVIDLHTSSLAFAEKLGPEASAELASKSGDATHFNEKGARSMADLVMQDLPVAEPRLKPLLKVP